MEHYNAIKLQRDVLGARVIALEKLLLQYNIDLPNIDTETMPQSPPPTPQLVQMTQPEAGYLTYVDDWIEGRLSPLWKPFQNEHDREVSQQALDAFFLNRQCKLGKVNADTEYIQKVLNRMIAEKGLTGYLTGGTNPHSTSSAEGLSGSRSDLPSFDDFMASIGHANG